MMKKRLRPVSRLQGWLVLSKKSYPKRRIKVINRVSQANCILGMEKKIMNNSLNDRAKFCVYYLGLK